MINIFAYSNSLMDNFIMDVQGSGYIQTLVMAVRLTFSAMRETAAMPIANIGKVLIDRGEVKKTCSMQAILSSGRNTQ
ncbi:MltA domain-containing protein [Escherichia coli]